MICSDSASRTSESCSYLSAISRLNYLDFWVTLFHIKLFYYNLKKKEKKQKK